MQFHCHDSSLTYDSGNTVDISGDVTYDNHNKIIVNSTSTCSTTDRDISIANVSN